MKALDFVYERLAGTREDIARHPWLFAWTVVIGTACFLAGIAFALIGV